MLILLPPSETKRAGGRGAPLDLGALSYPSLREQRQRVVAGLVSLSSDEDAAARVLSLSAGQRGDIAVNAQLWTAPTMAAVDRYTGVLFDALDAATLEPAARRWLGRNATIHSAPFGPVGALERIPAYRLGATASLPGLPSPKKTWAEAVTAAIALSGARFVLDLRSEAYVALGPVPASVPSVYVRVVADNADGVTRALNHFNKHAKGALVRALAQERPRVGSASALMRWGEAARVHLRPAAAGELHLVV